MNLHLVLIETSGNQQYIFATNKLRENVGASELTYRVGTEWLLDAVHQEGGPKLWNDNPATFRENLLNQKSISDPNIAVEVLVATSGKALLLAKEFEIGRRIVQRLTIKALEFAPGIDVCGVVSEGFEWESKPLGEVNGEVHKKFEEVRASRPGSAMRFLRLPIIEDCQSSGLPASRWHAVKNDEAARSVVNICKQEHREAFENRLQKLPRLSQWNVNFARNVGKLEEECEWLAVVHADGNGLGEIFLNFGKYAGCQPDPPVPEYGELNETYVSKFRRFSLALDVCTEKAFISAMQKLLERDADVWFKLPILPLVLGGDDLTIVCDGKAALQFTKNFLTEFESETEQATDVRELAQAALGLPRLSACAGVAIIKPHFPFSAAYGLAEELIKSAKQIKRIVKNSNKEHQPWPCSAIDFHALYDSTISELEEIRGRKVDDEFRGKLIVNEGKTRLYARPYVVTNLDMLERENPTGLDWAKKHDWQELEKRVNAILHSDKDEQDRRALPNSQLHDLRAGLFLGQEAANERHRLISHRYESANLNVFEESNNNLFFEDSDSRKRKFNATKLLDAMDAANFWIGESQSKGGNAK